MRFLFQLLSVVLASILAIGPVSAQSPVPSSSAAGANLQIHVVESDGAQVAPNSRSVKGFVVDITDAAGAPVPDAAVVVRFPETGSTGTFADGTHAAVSYTDQAGRAHISGIQWSAVSGSIPIKVTATKGSVHAGILIEQTLAGIPNSKPTEPVLPQAAPAPPPISQDSLSAASETKPEPALASPAPKVSVQQPGAVGHPSRALSASAPASVAPMVSVTNGPTHQKVHSGGGKAKWIILAAVAVGAGAGVAMAGKGKSGSSSSSTPSISIGQPTISVGHP
jgi:hypothetical protein